MLALIFALAGCHESAPLEDRELGGVVTDARSGDAIANARVTFTSDTRRTASTTSETDGSYVIHVETDVPHGEVRAERSGYEAGEATVFFDTPQRRIDLALRPLE